MGFQELNYERKIAERTQTLMFAPRAHLTYLERESFESGNFFKSGLGPTRMG